MVHCHRDPARTACAGTNDGTTGQSFGRGGGRVAQFASIPLVVSISILYRCLAERTARLDNLIVGASQVCSAARGAAADDLSWLRRVWEILRTRSSFGGAVWLLVAYARQVGIRRAQRSQIVPGRRGRASHVLRLGYRARVGRCGTAGRRAGAVAGASCVARVHV
jgi:hypothetical protein